MTDYKSLYYSLFNGITDIAASLEQAALSAEDEQLRALPEGYIIALRQLQSDAERSFIHLSIL